jgi:flagellar hook-associated protein 2
MGTVGISFGSPTAGTGFDVSATVSQIVANLQNVETPWKSQLSTLGDQDTAISNLGSLLSTLSNDVSQFTDFQGVLSQKEGSSSDPNAIALTSASSSAVAGNHSIVVNSLASTSSGFLTGVSSATDTLSGSISIAVGSGAAQVVNIDSADSTLAGLAATINSASIGVTASVITDTSGSRLSLVSGTSGAGGDITVNTAGLTDTSTGATLGYASQVPGANASFTVDGISVSTASNTVSTVIPGVTFQLLAPSTDPVSVQIVNDTADVTSAVEAFVSDYNSVVSAVNSQESNTSSGTPEPLFGSPTLSILQQQILGAIDTNSPSGYLDPIANASDSLSGSLSITVGSGSATNFSLSTGETLTGLAAAINSAGIGVSAGVITNSTGTSLSLTSIAAGAAGKLAVTSNVTDGSTTLGYNALSDINSLSQLGISVNNDGTISLDAASFANELNSDFSGVVGFFQNANSWGVDFSNTLNNLGTSNTAGTLSLALKSDSATETSLNKDISNEDLVISAQQSRLTQELTSADEILQSIPSNLNNVNELYSAITGFQAPSVG